MVDSKVVLNMKQSSSRFFFPVRLSVLDLLWQLMAWSIVNSLIHWSNSLCIEKKREKLLNPPRSPVEYIAYQKLLREWWISEYLNFSCVVFFLLLPLRLYVDWELVRKRRSKSNWMRLVSMWCRSRIMAELRDDAQIAFHDLSFELYMIYYWQ